MNAVSYALLIFLFSIAGCEGLRKEKVADMAKTSGLALFAKGFMDKHPDWSADEGMNGKTNKDFRDSLEMALRMGMLDDFPMEMGDLHEYSWGKYVVDFNMPAGNALPGSHFIKKTVFKVVGLIDQGKTVGLKKGRSYLIKGRFIKFLSGEYIGCADGQGCTTFIGLTRNPPAYELSLGIALLDIGGLTEVSQASR